MRMLKRRIDEWGWRNTVLHTDFMNGFSGHVDAHIYFYNIYLNFDYLLIIFIISINNIIFFNR